MKLLLTVSVLILRFAFCMGQDYAGVWDVSRTGAKGDGKTLDTKAIQMAIDRCHKAGGGQVTLQGGSFLSGTLYLKDNVTLHIAAGATLLGSPELKDYPSAPSAYPSYFGDYNTGKMLVFAENAKNIAITGQGKIDGRGEFFKSIDEAEPFTDRPRIIHFRGCENVRIRDITLYNGSSWIQSYEFCKNMVIDGIFVDSRENKDIEKPRYADSPGRNTDGLDLVDCEQVRISNCYINSGDDAICLKSLSPLKGCKDIVVTNCVVSSNASGIKIGTNSAGAFEDILVQNCTVFDTRGEALSIISADGARIERVNYSNISLRNIKGAAIFVRLESRHTRYHKDPPRKSGELRDILISNIQGTRISGYGCSITGLPDNPVENVTLQHINLEFTDGGKRIKHDDIPRDLMTDEERRIESDRQVPELEKAYPSGRMFGRTPAYGFFVRHAGNIRFDHVALRFAEEDIRPALIFDDVRDLTLQHLKAQATGKTPEVVRLVNVRGAVISHCSAPSASGNFLSFYGKETDNVRLFGNTAGKGGKAPHRSGEEVRPAAIREGW